MTTTSTVRISCHDCDRPYGDQNGFPDLIIPNADWTLISPTGDEGGLLCPSCICGRLYEAGIRTAGIFRSGPLCDLAAPDPNRRSCQ